MHEAASVGPAQDQFQRQLQEKETRITALEKRLADATEFPEQEQQRFAATAMGLSYGQARELLEIVVKKMSQSRDDWSVV